MSDAAQLISGRARARFRVVRIHGPGRHCVQGRTDAAAAHPVTGMGGSGDTSGLVVFGVSTVERCEVAAAAAARTCGATRTTWPSTPFTKPANRRWRVPWPVRRPRRRPRRAARRLHGTTPTRRYGGSPGRPPAAVEGQVLQVGLDHLVQPVQVLGDTLDHRHRVRATGATESSRPPDRTARPRGRPGRRRVPRPRTGSRRPACGPCDVPSFLCVPDTQEFTRPR